MRARVLSAICVLLATVTVAQSRRWFAHELNCWITQEKVPASWEDAQRRCEKYGEVLASPLNTQLYNYLQSRINVYNDSDAYFIGTRAKRSDDGQEVDYVSVEGRRLDDMPMAVFDAIKQLDPEHGDCLSMDGHRIRTVSCWDPLRYICYSNETECGLAPATTPTPSTTTPTTSTTTPTPSTTTPTPPPTSTIPPGYIYKPATGSYYKVHESTATWYEAKNICESEGAHLVVLNDAKEADIIKVIVRAVVNDDATWIGLHDNRPGGQMDWRTVHGERISEVYHEWRSGRPCNQEGYTCGVLGTWYHDLVDWTCDGPFHTACEISH